MIRMAAESAHAEGKWIGICGELGADVTLTETFLKMGIDELSVAPGMVLKVRQKSGKQSRNRICKMKDCYFTNPQFVK